MGLANLKMLNIGLDSAVLGHVPNPVLNTCLPRLMAVPGRKVRGRKR